MITEVRFTDTEQSFHARLQLVINPDTTHRIVDCREDHHRVLIRILVHDLLIHLEQVAVFLCYHVLAQTLDSVAEIQEHGQSGIVHTVSGIATLFCCTARYVTRYEVSECRITTLQIVIAVFFRNVTSLDLTGLQFLRILKFLRNPDTTVVTKRLRHQRQLTLEVSVFRNTCRVNLCVARICEVCAVTIHLHRCRTVTCHRVR